MMLKDSHLRLFSPNVTLKVHLVPIMFLMGTHAVSQVRQLTDQVTILCIPPPSNPSLLSPRTHFY